ncbi:hypothetical protein NUACC26_088360 [Scytonema sp. NUACC26]
MAVLSVIANNKTPLPLVKLFIQFTEWKIGQWAWSIVRNNLLPIARVPIFFEWLI